MRRPIIGTIVGTALLLANAGPAAAQTRGALRDGVGVTIDQGPAAVPAPSQWGAVDERALRHYASQYDYAAVDREIARLKAMHPGWEPPRDLFGGTGAPGADVDVSSLWAAYDRGDFAAVRRDIAALRRVNPSWEPPPELVELMAAAETRTAMKAELTARNWQEVVAIAEQNPSFVTPAPAYIENLWMAAEAHHELGEDQAVYALYRRVWDAGATADLRLSTLQKALANRNDRELNALVALESDAARDGGEEARFDQIKRDIAGGGGGTPSESDRLGQRLAAVSDGAPSADELAAIEASALSLRHADAAQVIGWYHYDHDDLAAAEAWFERSLTWKPSANAADGLARTLMAQGETERAEEIALEWAGRDPRFATLRRDLEGSGVALQGDPRQRLAATTKLVRGDGRMDPGLLVAQGWALYELERVSEAAEAFERALEGAGRNGKQRGEAAYGLAHAHIARGLTEQARDLLSNNALTHEQRMTVEDVLIRREAVDARNAGRYAESNELIRMVRSRGAADDPSLAALEAWNLLELGQVSEARAIFADLHATFPTAETKAGLKAVLGRQYPGSTWM